jgi:L-aminopeptidase/D-esterase-like protein
MLTDVAGVRVGHWTDDEAETGCTVVILPEGTVASGEIRGGAPATREFALLAPHNIVQHVDAVVLSGGSAFGLAAGDGAMAWLESEGRGFPTKSGPVPIVVGMSLYDLAVGDGSVRPGAEQGRVAALAASGAAHDVGRVGAGRGATIGKWGGPDTTTSGGLATATMRSGDVVVSALIAVNALGWIDDGSTVSDPGPRWTPPDVGSGSGAQGNAEFGNTTIGVVVTNAIADKTGCHLAAQSAHDGFARALQPAHTAADGDGLVVAATGAVEADLAHLRVLVQHTVVRAIRSLHE